VLDSRTKIVTLFVQGLVYLFNQDYAQARDEFAQTYKLIPYYEGERIKSVVLFFKGWSLWKSGDTAAAQEAFTETLQLNEEYSWAYIGLGNLDFDAAMEAKGSGEECAPYDTSLLDDALTDYQRAIETHRTQVEGPSKAALVEAKAYANIGNVYYELAEQHYCTYQDEALVQNLQRSEDALAEALRLYAAALQDNVAVAHQYAVYVHYALGRTYLLADDLDNAEQQFNHCINQTTESVRNKETAQLCEKGLNRIAELRDTQ
jgi:tetratricopeptide (TPR) repeat protein